MGKLRNKKRSRSESTENYEINFKSLRSHSLLSRILRRKSSRSWNQKYSSPYPFACAVKKLNLCALICYYKIISMLVVFQKNSDHLNDA